MQIESIVTEEYEGLSVLPLDGSYGLFLGIHCYLPITTTQNADKTWSLFKMFLIQRVFFNHEKKHLFPSPRLLLEGGCYIFRGVLF